MAYPTANDESIRRGLTGTRIIHGRSKKSGCLVGSEFIIICFRLFINNFSTERDQRGGVIVDSENVLVYLHGMTHL
jgi:hypothetical protein